MHFTTKEPSKQRYQKKHDGFHSVFALRFEKCFVHMAGKRAAVQKYTGVCVCLSGAAGGVNTSSITFNAAVLESRTGVNKML